ncbi:MAG: M23 family metallopeptidase [Solirubrobacterales bacterium]
MKLLSCTFRVVIGAVALMLVVAPSAPAAASGGSGGAGPSGKKVQRTPVIAAFRLETAIVDGGRLGLAYRITAPAKRVRVRAVVRTSGGTFVKTMELGLHRTNTRQAMRLTLDDLGVSRSGKYKVRLSARDGKGRSAKRAKEVPAWRSFNYSSHRFPVVGKFSFGGEGAKFGAGRPGHIHQGQDVVADSGTPVVAPYGGTISYVAYQAGGAGYYVVEHADDGRDYVFMHFLKDSTVVKLGDQVKTGQRLGLVGATGDASGPHLHFEVWTGGAWQFGGKPVDPLPLLKSWYASGAGGAVRTSAVRAGAAVVGGRFD